MYSQQHGLDVLESWLRKTWNTAREKAGTTKTLTLSGATRHSAASEASLDGVDIYRIKEAIGHKDVRTTIKYTHPTKSAMRDTIERKVIDLKIPKSSLKKK